MAVILLAKPDKAGDVEAIFLSKEEGDDSMAPVDLRNDLTETKAEDVADWIAAMKLEAAILVYHESTPEDKDFGILNAQRILQYYNGPIYLAENGRVTGRYNNDTFFSEYGEAVADTRLPTFQDVKTLADEKLFLFGLVIDPQGTNPIAPATTATTTTAKQSATKKMSGMQIHSSCLTSSQNSARKRLKKGGKRKITAQEKEEKQKFEEETDSEKASGESADSDPADKAAFGSKRKHRQAYWSEDSDQDLINTKTGANRTRDRESKRRMQRQRTAND